jgi:GT2 family glycosyltransferase
MNASRRRSVVVLGMMTKIPVAGVVWQTLHYLLGFQRLGFDVTYVEAHARTPSMLMATEQDNSGALAAEFVDGVLRRFDLADRWSYVALHADGTYYGLSRTQMRRVYRSAEAIVNLHGGTEPLPEHAATGRLVYIETDPVQLQVELHDGVRSTADFLEQHCAFFTFGENYGNNDCGLPVSERFRLLPTRQPVVLDLWQDGGSPGSGRFTTVANWRQQWRDVTLAGEIYGWSKHAEFERILDLPGRTGHEFELTLASCEAEDRALLRSHGWRVRDAATISADIDAYRAYVSRSKAELTVAKDQNVRLRSGWFSDRSATYLAAGRPVVTQDTGFGCALPTGAGLHSFTDLDEAVEAVERVCSGYRRERETAREVARECFDSDLVLGELLDAVGISVRSGGRTRGLPDDLDLVPVSRRPLRLPDATLSSLLERPVPFPAAIRDDSDVSVIVVTRDNLALTRLCLESLLDNPDGPPYEIVVVDNASTDGTRPYLLALARRAAHVRVVLNDENAGFPRACNQGLDEARGSELVILNNDTIVSRGWLGRLRTHLVDPHVGLVGPVTNRIGNEAEIPVDYATLRGFRALATRRAAEYVGQAFEISMPAMFCLAFRRDVCEQLGSLDEGFGLGTLEDDDYALRSSAAGYRNLCAEDVLVHHFGEATFGALYASGEHSRLLENNRLRFEEKWGMTWQPYDRRSTDEYQELQEHVRSTLSTALPEGARVIVVSRGDEELVRLDGRRGLHFPQEADGVYAGHYPSDSGEAIAQLEALRLEGGDYFALPRTGFWWLDHYEGFRDHLETHYPRVVSDESCVVFALGGRGTS